MDLVPRDENGAPIVPKNAGVMHLYRAVSVWSHSQAYIPPPAVNLADVWRGALCLVGETRLRAAVSRVQSPCQCLPDSTAGAGHEER